MPHVTLFRLASVAGAAAVGLWLAAVSGGLGERPPVAPPPAPAPDLRLVWRGDPGPDLRRPLSLIAGRPRRLEVGVANVGEAGAFDVTIELLTPLGPSGPPIALGSLDASESTEVELIVTPAVGMRELCVVASLRPLPDGSADPNLDDSRLCRRLEIKDDIQ